jgi:ABC-type nitrate/sulfonate/bicarbonate transport system substrate-binding protein
MQHLMVSKPRGSGFAVHWTALLAQRLGYDVDEGLDIEIVPLGQDEGTAALRSGAVPVMRRGPDETLADIAAGEPLALVAGLLVRAPIYLYASAGIRTIADLRGQTIAGISARFGSSLVLRMLLADAGLQPGDYAIEHVGGSYERFAALRDGRAVAAVLSPPTDAHAQRAGYRLLANLPERYPQLSFSAIQVQRAFAERNPEIVIALLKAEIRAQGFLADPNEKSACIGLLADADGLTRAEATAVYETMVERDRVFATDGEIAPVTIGVLIDAMSRFGDLTAPPPEDAIDRQYLRDAHRRLAAAPVAG